MTKTYAQLTREIQALQASAEKLRASEIKAATVQINEMIATYGLTAADLRFPGATSTSARRQGASSSAPARSGASTDAKYSDGQGHTWGGRGPRPAWLRQAISGGRSLESFETSGASATARPSPDDGASKPKLPAVYGHPKTGQTWSGRGPKPTWLKQALKKRGTTVDDFRLPAQTSASAEASAPARAQSKGPRPRGKSPTVKPTAAAGKSPTGKVGAKPAKTVPDAAKAPAAVKATASAPAKKAPAKKTATAGAAPDAATPAAAKKVAPKTPAKADRKPAAKTPSAPRKNLPASMAPPADAAPTPSTVPTAAPMPAATSESVEGRGDTAGS